jgi:hypothetical protein
MIAKEIAAEALKIDVSKRALFLKRACGGDQALLAETQALLETDGATTATIATA